MDYTGLYANKYRLNRKLTTEERTNQFHQNVKLDITPFYNLSVIRMNSTYLECVDRWFIYRGSMTAISLLFFALTIAMVTVPLYMFPPAHFVPTRSDVGAMLFAIPFLAPLWALLSWGVLKESFRQTHFPIRFNRRTRMVYVFKPNGTLLKAKWRDIFFTLGRCERMAGVQNWDIRGHVLDKDRETVLDTFALPGDTLAVSQIKHEWEFFRRYMEDGPAAIHEDVFWCHDIAERREKYKAGLVTLFFELNGQPVGQFLLSPVYFAASLGRWFAMRTSKIPVWPEDIETQCVIEQDDPYVRDASNNPEKIPMEPLSVARSRIE
ncbi:DUF6708 domain-containing protein [Paraburkholderia sp. MPAMCS5]|uniref:DUF6708 domain-containing protein n=1 Tax=Paraburkholderia sp. MPAMCS5 TaxID=3112563 RepID=UPI002E18AFC6|nr:DUF6708 domain-containing protein [Paraburkholderia sp. MPAMCS5]